MEVTYSTETSADFQRITCYVLEGTTLLEDMSADARLILALYRLD
jgi:hypothetical protein